MNIVYILLNRAGWALIILGGLLAFAPQLIVKALGDADPQIVMEQAKYAGYVVGLSWGCWLLLSISNAL